MQRNILPNFLLILVCLLFFNILLLGQETGCLQQPCAPTPCPPPDPSTLLTGDTTTHYFNDIMYDGTITTIIYDSLGNFVGVETKTFKGDTLQIQCGKIYKFYVEANGIYEWNTDISYNVVPTYANEQLRTKITLFYDDFRTSAIVSDRAVNSTVEGNAAAGLSWWANYTGVVGIMVTRGDEHLDTEGNYCECNDAPILLRYDQRRVPSSTFVVWGRYGTVRELPCDNRIHHIYDSGTNSQLMDASGDYSNNEDGYLVLYPGDIRSKLKLWGSSILDCGDTLFIYNGNIEENPNLVPYDTITGPGTRTLGTSDQPLFMSAIPGDPITLRMKSDSSCTLGGLELQAKCCQNPGLPVNLQGAMTSDTTALITWEPGEGNELVYNWELYSASDSTLLFSGSTMNSRDTVFGLNPNECYFYTISVISACSNDTASNEGTDVMFSNVFCYSYFVMLGTNSQQYIVSTDSVYIPDGAYIDSTNSCGCGSYGVNIVIYETDARVCYGNAAGVCYSFSINEGVDDFPPRRLVWETPYTLLFSTNAIDTAYQVLRDSNVLNIYEINLPSGVDSGCLITSSLYEDGYVMLTAYTEGWSVTRATIHFTIDTLPDVRILVNGMDTALIVSCEGEPLQLTARNAQDYNWYSTPDFLTSNSQSRTTHLSESFKFRPVRNDTVTVVGIDGHGCVGYDTLDILINPLPDLRYTSHYTVCQGDSLLLRVEGIEQYEWQRIDTIRWIDTVAYTQSNVSESQVCNKLATLESVYGYVLVQLTSPPNTIDTVYLDSIHSPNFQCNYPGGNNKKYKITHFKAVLRDALDSVPLFSGNSDSLWVRPEYDTDYRIFGEDTNGCHSRRDAYIHVTVLPRPKVTDTSSTPFICAGDAAFMSVEIADEEHYFYEWSQVGQDSILSQTTSLQIVPDSSCTYQVRVVHLNHCDTVVFFPITVNPLPVIEVTAEPAVICPQTSSTLTASSPTVISWLWEDSTVTAVRVVTPTAPTEYSVMGTDVNGCTSSQIVPITIHPAPGHEFLANDSICLGSSATLVLSGNALNYQWHNSDPSISVEGYTAIVNPTVTTVYTVSYENEYGCKDTTEVTVAVFEFPSPVITPDVTICRDDSVRLQASGGLYFLWDDDNGSTDSVIVVAPIDTTTYSVYVYDFVGCGSTGQVTVNVIPHFQLSITSDVDSICPENVVTFTAHGGNSYMWNNDPQYQTNTFTVTPDSTTTATPIVVSLSALNNATNCSMTIYDTVMVMPYPEMYITAMRDTLCYGDSTILTIEGNAAHYQWSTGETTQSIVVAPSASQTYYVDAYSDFNCVSRVGYHITVHELPNADITPVDSSICYNRFLVIGVPASPDNLEYHWSYPNIPDTSSEFIYKPLENVPNTYMDTLTVEVVNIYGCHQYGQAVITVHPMPRDMIIAPEGECITDTITLSLSGNYEYLWDSPVPQQFIHDAVIHVVQSETTEYRVVVNTEHGCSVTLSQTVEAYALPDVVIHSDADSVYFCGNQAYTLTASGALEYVWNNNQTSESIQVSPPLSAATYSVVGTDEHGCKYTASFTPTIITPPDFYFVVPFDTICHGQVCNVRVVLDSFDLVHYYWNNYPNLSDTTRSLTYYSLRDELEVYIDTIEVRVVNLYGCEQRRQTYITVYPLPHEAILAPEGECSRDSITLTLSGDNHYVWYPPVPEQYRNATSIRVKLEQTTNYSVQITTDYGCAIDTSKTVEMYPLPDVYIQSYPETMSFCRNQSYTLRAVFPENNQTQIQRCIWSTGQEGEFIDILPPLDSVYYVTAIDEHGCRSTDYHRLHIVSPPSVQLNIFPSSTICAGDSVTIQAMGDLENIVWSTNDTTYNITLNNVIHDQVITAVSGNTHQGVKCYSYDTVRLVVVQLPELSMTANRPSICAHDTGIIVVSGADSYEWVYNDILVPHGDTAYIIPLISTETITETFSVWGILSDHACRSVTQMPFTIYGLPDIHIQAAAEGGNICSSDTIQLQASGGTVYHWYESDFPTVPVGNRNTISVSPEQSTSYFVYVETEHGCHDTMSYLVTVHGHPSLDISLSDSVVCRGESVQLEATTSGHVFSWNNTQTLDASDIANPVAVPQITTTYIVEVTDTVTHCNTVDSVLIWVNQLPQVQHVGPHSLCWGDSLSVTVSGAIQYDWYGNDLVNILHSGSSFQTLPVDFPTALYQVIGTDGNGCKDTLSIPVSIYALPEPNLEVSYPGYLCMDRGSFLGLSVQTDIPCTEYQWISIPFDRSLIDQGSIAFISPDTTTTYIIRSSYLTDGVVCSANDTAVVHVYPTPTVQASVMPELVCVGSEAVLSVTGADHYMWLLNNQIVGASASYTCYPEQNQQYVVMGIDTNNCIGTDTVTIQMVNTLPKDTVFGPTSTCFNVPVTVYTTGRNHCEWYPRTGLSEMSDSSVTMTLTETQTYTLYFTDEHGCSDSLHFTMTVHPLPELTMPHEVEICQGQEYSFRVTGASSYVWEDGSSNDFRTVSPDSTTVYVVTAYNRYQCSVQDSLVLTVIRAFDLHIISSRDSFCIEDNAVTLTAYGAGDTYEWNTGSRDSVITVYPTETTTYTLTAYNTYLNCSTSMDYVVQRMPTPDFEVLSSGEYICKNDTMRLWVSGEHCAQVMWRTLDTAQEVYVSPSVTTDYHVVVTSNFGCSAESNVTVEVKPLPQVQILASADTVCKGGMVYLKAVGNAAQYRWNTGYMGDSLAMNQQYDAQYVVTAYSEFLCTASDSIRITVNPLPEYTMSTLTPSICRGDTAVVLITGQNTLVWYPAESVVYSDSGVAMLMPQKDTVYTSIVTNQYGCKDTFDVEIDVVQPQDLQISADTLICVGESVTLQVSGSWNYLWNNGETSNFFTVSPTETTVYSVSSVDEYGCVTVAQTTVFVQPDFQLVIIASRDSFCLEENSITLTAYGAGDTFEWSTGSRDSVITVYPTESTVYTLTAYNTAVNCSNSIGYPIVRKPDPDFVILPNRNYICEDDEIELSVSHNDYVHIVWSTSDTTPTIILAPDSGVLYSAVLTNAYGCHSYAERYIEVKPLPQFSIVASDTVACLGETILLQAVGNADHYVWNSTFIGNSMVIDYLTNALYRVTAYSEYQCVSSDSIHIVVNPLPEYSISAPSHTLCVGDTAVLNINGQNNWLWYPSNSIVYNDNIIALAVPDESIDYTAFVINQYGCADTTTVHIEVYPPLPLQVGADTVLCQGQSVTLHVTGSWNYLWSNGETGSSFTVTPDENTLYSVSSTDEHGCVTTRSTNVQVRPDFNFELNVTRDTICVGDSTTLWYYGSADQHLWSTGSTGNYIVEHPTTTSTYSVWAYNNSTGCAKNVHTTIVVIPYPQIQLHSSPLVCPDDTVIVSVSSYHPFHYQWTSNPAGSIVSATDTAVITAAPAESSYYILTASNQFCEVQDSVLVQTATLPSIVVADIHDETCEGRNGSIGIEVETDYPPVSIVWSNGYNTTENQIFNLPAGSYSVTATDHLGCSQTLYDIVVENITPPEIEVTNIEAMLNMRDGAVTIQVNHYYGDYTIEWYSDEELLHRLDQYTNQLSLYGLEAGDYWVVITDEACSSIQEIHIPRIPDGEGTIYVPNAFTPTNQDGINDYFSIYYSGDVEFQAIYIFTRWGEQVYESTDPHFKWDGSYHGRINKYVVYDYVIYYLDYTGEPVTKTGSITVL